jgi:hypothetical protein
MKTCTKCLLELPENLFRVRKSRSGKPYRISVCINCERKQKKIAEKKRYHNLTEEEKFKHYKRSKVTSVTESYKKWRRVWQKDREQNNPEYLLKRRFSILMRNKINKCKNSSFDILVYSVQELRTHLEKQFEPWMDWNNWGKYDSNIWDDEDPITWTWQIDHIIPINYFNCTSIYDESFQQCWALGSLRPLSVKENYSYNILI